MTKAETNIYIKIEHLPQFLLDMPRNRIASVSPLQGNRDLYVVVLK